MIPELDLRELEHPIGAPRLPHTYRVPRSDLLGVGAFSAIWSGISIAVSFQEPPASFVFLLVALVPLGYLFVFTRVTLGPDGACEFRSAVRRRRVRAQQVKAISTDDEAIYVHHEHGKMHMWATDEFEELVSDLLRLNPAIELKGWVRSKYGATAPPS